MSNGLPDGWDAFDVDVEPREESPRDRCIRRLTALKKGDTVRIGKHKWTVWRSTGVSNIVTKAGTKGRKLYQINTTEIDRCCVEVIEVNPGTGEPLGKKPAAKGCSISDTAWAGARGHKGS